MGDGRWEMGVEKAVPTVKLVGWAVPTIRVWRYSSVLNIDITLTDSNI
jgi:hypothetical protein